MGEEEDRRANDIVATKLDILISDFKEFKRKQEKANDRLAMHMLEEEKMQASINTTLTWHTVIGTFIVGVVMFMLYAQLGGN